MNFRAVQFEKAIGFSTQLGDSLRKEIAFCGRSNVGKSTLLNKLCGNNKLAKTSSTPGKTTTINYFTLDKDYYLVDLPGYGFSKRSKQDHQRWGRLMESFFSSQSNLVLAIQLLDIRHKPSQEDEDMLNYYQYYQTPFLVVLTKKDKLNKTQLLQQTQFFENYLSNWNPSGILPFSANSQEDAEKLRNWIEAFVEP